MAHELMIRDTSRSYAVRAVADPAPEPATPAGDARRLLVHALLARVLACVSAASVAEGWARQASIAGMPCTCVRFSTQTLPASKFAELDRQLAGQQQGLNALTVEEYLAARARFDARERDPQVARRERVSWRAKLLDARRQALQRDGCSAELAQRLAAEHADRQMRGLHALHNPDRIAGGRDVIADFGDGQVNSTIGRQWNLARRGELSRVQQLDCAASCVPGPARACTRMNGVLKRDGPALADVAGDDGSARSQNAGPVPDACGER